MKNDTYFLNKSDLYRKKRDIRYTPRFFLQMYIPT
jgi:hypothetical protein